MDKRQIQLPDEYSALAGKTCLVTGAAGFIGGNLFRRLALYGIDVVGTVLYPEEARALEKEGFNAKVLDLASDDSWENLVQGIDIVFHVAAMFQEVEFGKDQYEKVNHIAALKLARTASDTGVERFIHCSTIGVHGSVREIPANESTPYNPMDEYHETKLAGELAILEFARQLPEYGMTVVVNRPAMVYGPGDLRMLKLFDRTLTRRFRMIGSGETLAHLGYIEDQTDSFLLCAIAPRADVHCEAFNIASGEPVTLNALVAEIAVVGGVTVPRLHVPVAPVWIAALLCEIVCKPFGIKPPLFRRRVGFFTHDRAFDLAKARSKLGYRSRWSLRDGVASTIKWYRDNDFVPGR